MADIKPVITKQR